MSGESGRFPPEYQPWKQDIITTEKIYRNVESRYLEEMSRVKKESKIDETFLKFLDDIKDELPDFLLFDTEQFVSLTSKENFSTKRYLIAKEKKVYKTNDRAIYNIPGTTSTPSPAPFDPDSSEFMGLNELKKKYLDKQPRQNTYTRDRGYYFDEGGISIDWLEYYPDFENGMLTDRIKQMVVAIKENLTSNLPQETVDEKCVSIDNALKVLQENTEKLAKQYSPEFKMRFLKFTDALLKSGRISLDKMIYIETYGSVPTDKAMYFLPRAKKLVIAPLLEKKTLLGKKKKPDFTNAKDVAEEEWIQYANNLQNSIGKLLPFGWAVTEG